MENMLTRRAIAAAFPLAALTVAPVTAVSAAPSLNHPDSALLSLDLLLAAANARSEAFAERCDDTYEGFEPPTVPDELVWQGRDFPSVWVDPHRLDSLGNSDEGKKRYIYASDGVLESLRAKLARWKALPPLDRNCTDRDVARVEEIVASLQAYQAEEAKRYAACGFTAANEAYEAERDVIDGLLQKICSIPALTPEGICVKARALVVASLQSPELLERHRFAELLARRDRKPCETEELVTLAIMIDVAKLGGVMPSNQRSAA